MTMVIRIVIPTIIGILAYAAGFAVARVSSPGGRPPGPIDVKTLPYLLDRGEEADQAVARLLQAGYTLSQVTPPATLGTGQSVSLMIFIRTGGGEPVAIPRLEAKGDPRPAPPLPGGEGTRTDRASEVDRLRRPTSGQNP
jgi:hypothetical protein